MDIEPSAVYQTIVVLEVLYRAEDSSFYIKGQRNLLSGTAFEMDLAKNDLRKACRVS